MSDRKCRMALKVSHPAVQRKFAPGEEQAFKREMIRVPVVGDTIPHEVFGRFGAGKVVMKPASLGTGVIAGGPVRAVVEAAGIRNILTKSLGTNNPHNVIKATMQGLGQLISPETKIRMRSANVETHEDQARS